MSDSIAPAPSGSRWTLRLSILFGAAVVAAIGYLFIQIEGLRSDFAKFRTSSSTELARLKESSTVSTATHARHIETLREELETARQQATMAVGQAKKEALKRAEQLNAQLVNEQHKQL